MSAEQQEVTRALAECRAGDEEAVARLLPMVYDELRALAAGYLRRERSDHTLQPTALVHEAYIRLVDQTHATWQDRAHFIGIAARAMRQILVNHAIRHGAEKRGGGRKKIPIDEAVSVTKERAPDLLALDEALDKLNQVDAQKARMVELRFFGGLTIEEAAEVLGVSHSTVERGWRVARAWLGREIGKGDRDDA